MKTTTLLFLIGAVLCSRIHAADADLQAFAQRYADARDAGDAAALIAMHDLEAASEAEKSRVKEKVETSIKYRSADKHTAVSIEDKLDPEMDFTRIEKGEKIEVTPEPVGMIHVTYPKGSHLTPYGIKNGKPRLLAFKITKLDWNGPAEDFYQVSVVNSGDKPVNFTIEYAYKASGLHLQKKKEASVPAHGFNGTSIIANEVVLIRIGTSQPDAKLEATLNRNDAGKQTEIVKKTFDLTSPFVFEGKKP